MGLKQILGFWHREMWYNWQVHHIVPVLLGNQLFVHQCSVSDRIVRHSFLHLSSHHWNLPLVVLKDRWITLVWILGGPSVCWWIKLQVLFDDSVLSLFFSRHLLSIECALFAISTAVTSRRWSHPELFCCKEIDGRFTRHLDCSNVCDCAHNLALGLMCSFAQTLLFLPPTILPVPKSLSYKTSPSLLCICRAWISAYSIPIRMSTSPTGRDMSSGVTEGKNSIRVSIDMELMWPHMSSISYNCIV